MTDQTARVVIVTGASRGIGRATAVAFARDGWRVVLAARNAEALAALAAGLPSHAPPAVVVAGDLAVAGAGRALVARTAEVCGRVDCVVNNAAVAPLAPIDALSPDDFEATLALNVRLVFETTQAAWPLLAASRGIIINISSLAAFDPFPGFQAYGASKAWVNLYTRAIADEGRSSGIRAYAVAAGAVDTELLQGLFPDYPPEARLAPEEVAEFILALTSEAARGASGDTIRLRR